MQNSERRHPARERAKRIIFDKAPTVTLWGSVLGIVIREARRANLNGIDGMGWDGTNGMEYQKCPLNFFILCK